MFLMNKEKLFLMKKNIKVKKIFIMIFFLINLKKLILIKLVLKKK